MHWQALVEDQLWVNGIADLAALLMPVDPEQTIAASAKTCRLVQEP